MNKYASLILILIFYTLSIEANAQNKIRLFDAKTLDFLPFANIKLTLEENNNTKYTTSDELGFIELPFNTSGKVDLVISYLGYQTLYKTITIGQVQSLYLIPYEEELKDVVVTANAKETTTKESIYKIEVIGKDEIENKSANTLDEVLMHNEKIELRHDALGTSITMQGLSGTNIKIMIDGVPVIGRLNGEIDISKINLSNIERIEIVQGPLSVIYGSNALAGVINLISKKSHKTKFGAYINAFYQSVGNYNLEAQVSYKFKRHFLSINAGRHFFDGYNEGEYDRDMSWDPKETYFSDLTYVYRTKKDWFHRLKFSYFQDKILDRKDPAGPFTIADDQWFKTRRIDAAYIVNGKYKEDFYIQSTNGYNNYQRIKTTYTKDLSTLSSILKKNSDYNNYQDKTSLNQYISRTSIAYNNKESIYNYQIGYDLNIETGKGNRFSEEGNKEIIIADIVVFATFTYKPSKKLSIQPAMRYGYNSKFSTSPTLSASIKYDFTKDFIWRLSYGMGFRAPTLKELYLNFQDINHNIQGNENLKAEKSHNISSNLEISKNVNLHKFKFKLNGFFNHKYDGIVLAQNLNSNNKNEYTYQNAYQFQTLGFDMDLVYKIKNFKANTGFAYTGTYNKEKENNEDLVQFFFKPVFKLNASYHFKEIGLKVSVYNKFTGNYYDYFLDKNNEFVPIKLDSYDLLDFTASETFWKNRFTISAGIKNILDVSSINNSINSGGVHSSETGTQISTGRSYFIGLKFKY